MRCSLTKNPLENYIMSKTLYEKSFEHDACGVGLVASIDGVRTNKVLKKAIEAVVNLTHRGAVGGDKKTRSEERRVGKECER